MKRIPILILLLAWGGARLMSQGAGEDLGSSLQPGVKGPHPLLANEEAHPGALKPELAGVHPRVFVTAAEIEDLRQRARTSHRELWQHALEAGISLRLKAAPPPAQGRRDQNDVAMAMAEAAFLYRIEGDPRYLAAAKRLMDAAVSYDVWGYSSNKPNVDLAAGQLLYGMGWAYDLLFHDLTVAERARYRGKLTRQAHLLFESYTLKPGRLFTYSQNHTFIPAAGLGVAAYALYGEVPEAADWARRVRAIYGRVLETYSSDGYYYEGFEYWVFATPWIVHYLDALAHATGEDLYDQSGLRQNYKYAAHIMLPDGQNVFDFGDTFEGARTRLGEGPDYLRTHPGGHLHSNYSLLYRFAQRFHCGEAQGVAQWLASLGQVNFEDYWSLIWYDPSVKAVPIGQQPRWHYFPDHDVVFWRSGWGRDAVAVAIKCGPPEGHRTTALARRLPDWRLEDGHAHPDAASFILFADGRYLTGVSGYAGIPKTADSNTLLIDGQGQGREGGGHNAFAGVPYGRLNRIRITAVEPGEDSLHVVTDATAAYEPGLGLEKFVRDFNLRGRQLVVSDSIATASPHRFSILLHFDGEAAPAELKVDVRQPADAVIRLIPNIIAAAGPPGNVDKGPREQRGTRLEISTGAPSAQAEFETVLGW